MRQRFTYAFAVTSCFFFIAQLAITWGLTHPLFDWTPYRSRVGQFVDVAECERYFTYDYYGQNVICYLEPVWPVKRFIVYSDAERRANTVMLVFHEMSLSDLGSLGMPTCLAEHTKVLYLRWPGIYVYAWRYSGILTPRTRISLISFRNTPDSGSCQL